jgi:hypothetical protein
LNADTASAGQALAVDHLVVAAATLLQGVQWCETTLGVTPGPGGEHVLMGTHNRLLSVASAGFALAYLEIIAINPAAPGPPAGRQRWFGLDDPATQARLARQGPQLLHWVARSTGLAQHQAALHSLGLQPGEPVAASRATPAGLLQWQMLLRPDGSTLFGGAWPTLIEWQGPHPAQAMPASGITLLGLKLGGGIPASARALLLMPGLEFVDGPGPALTVTLQTPLGSRQLCSLP